MSTARVTIQFVVPIDYVAGDYAQLFGNGGSGDIDWETPLLTKKFDLYPDGAGIYGWGHAPWGHSRWGKAHSSKTPGWGHLPWGSVPFGHGTSIITISYNVTTCGDYKFSLGCFDYLGNQHSGDPEVETLYIHIAPDTPTGLTKLSYDKATDVLILNAA